MGRDSPTESGSVLAVALGGSSDIVGALASAQLGCYSGDALLGRGYYIFLCSGICLK